MDLNRSGQAQTRVKEAAEFAPAQNAVKVSPSVWLFVQLQGSRSGACMVVDMLLLCQNPSQSLCTVADIPILAYIFRT